MKIDDNKLEELYSSGKSTYELAKIFECSAETIRRRLKNRRTISEANKCRNIDMSSINKEKWKDPEYRKKMKMTDDKKRHLSEVSKDLWKIEKFKEKHNKAIKEASNKISQKVSDNWKKKEFVEKQKVHFQWRANKATQQSAIVL